MENEDCFILNQPCLKENWMTFKTFSVKTTSMFLLFGIFLLATGCEKNSQSGSAPDPRVTSATPSPSDPYGLPPGALSGGAPAAIAGGTVSGKISLDARLAGKTDPGAVLFISAKPAEGPQVGVPPVASKRLDHVKFPLDYTLSQQDVIMPGTPFSGKFNIVVKLMKNGAAGPVGPGDIEGHYSINPVDVGQKGIDVVLDTIH